MPQEQHQIEQPSSHVMQNVVSTASTFFTYPLPISTLCGLPHSIHEVGAHFFFANYSCDEPPLSKGYHAWLTQIYFENRPHHALRAGIEAAGMAGISNRYYAPYVAFKSKEQYGRALAATKQALSDPVEAVADTTLMAIILLGLFEVMSSILIWRVDVFVSHSDPLYAVYHYRGLGSP
jgi:hypothetical protein